MRRVTCLALALLFVATVRAAGAAEAAGGEVKGGAATVRAIRFKANPIIRPEMSASIGTNLNGPSLVRVPAWVAKPLGRYYLYFAHHGGKFIRLAYADRLEGPWTIHEPGVLRLEDTAASGHIASPDVHLDDAAREVRMYFHGPAAGGQKTFLATSKDALHFTAGREVLGEFYFRVFRWGGWWYAVAKEGNLYRSKDGVTPFEKGPNPFRFDSPGRVVRHSAVKLDGDRLSVFYSRIGDDPERILLSTINLAADWAGWRASDPVTVLAPEEPYEGADLPPAASASGAAKGRVRQVRDPAIYQEDGRTYLLYSVAGESGIAIAELVGGK